MQPHLLPFVQGTQALVYDSLPFNFGSSRCSTVENARWAQAHGSPSLLRTYCCFASPWVGCPPEHSSALGAVTGVKMSTLWRSDGGCVKKVEAIASGSRISHSTSSSRGPSETGGGKGSAEPGDLLLNHGSFSI